jgi:hypothetical protein
VSELEALRAENAALRAQLEALQASMDAQLERLKELLAAVTRKRQPAKTAKEPAAAAKEATSPPSAPTLDDAARVAFEQRPQPPPKPPKATTAPKSSKPTGRKPLPAHLEAETHRLKPEACSACGSRALDCDARTTPRSLPAPYARSKVTGDWLAWFVYQKFWMLTPLDRIRRDLEARNIPLAMGTLVSFIEHAADILSPIDDLHWEQLLAGSWLATDGTGLKVLVESLPEAHDGYIELYRNNETAVFQYEADKRGEVVEQKLASFKGTLTADAEHRFNGVYADGSVLEAGCNAHGRRKFEAAEAVQPALALEGGAFIGAMYGEEDKARALGLVGDALLRHRQQHTRPIADTFDRWLAAIEPTLLPSDPLLVAVRYYRIHGAALYRFIDDADVPIDNSPTEREFQNVAKLRLNMLFAGSSEGAHRACILLGIMATCRAQGVPVQAYLTWAFERLGTHRDAFDLPAAELTPAAYRRQMTTT